MSKTIKTAKATIHKLTSTDASYTIRELAKSAGFSISKVHSILKKNVFPLESFLQGGYQYHICCQTPKEGKCNICLENAETLSKF